MNHGNTTRGQIRPHIQTYKFTQPDKLIITVSRTTHQTHQTIEMGPTCFRCGEQGHMRMECKERVYCTNCKTANHDTKSMQETLQQHPKPHKQPYPDRLSPHSNTSTLNWSNSNRRTANTTNQCNQQWTTLPDLASCPNTKNQYHHPHTVQQRITNTIQQHDRSNNTDPKSSHQQQQERRGRQTNDQKTSKIF